ncbi:MAG: hypothetical protein HIU57_04845 [Acidobacteria bacterium]|nr:hypothetical protein [Acidobacteriota bacterium]
MEVLLALTILGLAAVALIVAFQTSITASSEHRNLSKITTAISDVTAASYSQVRVLDDPLTPATNLFTTQQDISQYQTDFDSVLTAQLNSIGFSAHVISVQFWDPTQKIFPSVNAATSESAFTAFQPQLMMIDITNTLTKKVTHHGVILTDPSVVESGSTPGTASQLEFYVEPSGATLNTAFVDQPVVELVDSFGRRVTQALPFLTISIDPGTGTAGANLSSTCTAVPNGAGLFVFSDCSIDQLGSGYRLLVSAPYVTSPAITPLASLPFDVAPVQLKVPSVTSVTPSASSAGAVKVNFTVSSNAPSGQNYVVTACTDPLMTVGCHRAANFAPDGTLSGLTPGAQYYLQVEAVASLGYLAATSPPVGPTMATVQLSPPTVTSLDYGASAGSLTVNFTGSSNAPSGQTYSATACDRVTSTCSSATPITPGAELSGLTYSSGSPGDSYTVTVSADSSTGYLASDPSAAVGAHNDTSSLRVPTKVGVAPSTSTAGAVTVSFTSPSGTQPSSFGAIVCTDAQLKSGCVTVASFTSGSEISGLIPGTPYWAEITEVAPTGFVGAPGVSTTSAPATTKLSTPTITSLDYGTSAGSLTVNFIGSSNAPSGQTYTAVACTSARTPVCTSFPSVFSDPATSGQLTGLTFTPGSPGTNYNVTLSADKSTGYLASATSAAVAPHNDTSAFAAPTVTSLGYGTNAGSLTVNFSATTPALGGQTYTAVACDTSTKVCTPSTPMTSGGQFTGLTFTPGSPGDPYTVTVIASANLASGYVASATSAAVAPHNDTSQLNHPTALSVTPSTLNAGAVAVSFVTPSQPVSTNYSALACTGPAMTGSCGGPVSIGSGGGQINGLTSGTAYFVQVRASTAVPGFTISSVTSSTSAPATTKLSTPTITSLDYGTSAGSLTVNFIGSSNAPSGQTYTAVACTSARTPVCTSFPSVFSDPATSGQLTGLTFTPGSPGTNYNVTLSADKSTGYLASATSAAVAPHNDTSAFAAPTVTSLGYGTNAGSLTVNFSATTPALGGQTYTAVACDTSTKVCTPSTPMTSGGQFTGLTFTPGSPGDPYTVTVIASANLASGYVASATSAAVAPHNDTSQLSPFTNLSATTSNNPTSNPAVYAISIGFSRPTSGPSPASYLAKACVDSLMSNCVSTTSFSSGNPLTGQIAGLSSTVNYYVQVTEISGSSAYASYTKTYGSQVLG